MATRNLKRKSSLDDINNTSADCNDQPTSQVAKKGKRGSKGKVVTTQSQPTIQSDTIESDIELDEVDQAPCCIVCTEEGSQSSTIQCEACDQFYHLKCCGIEEADHPVVKKLINVIGYMCKVCRDDVLNELNQLRKGVSKLESKLSNEVRHGKSEMFKIIGESLQQHHSVHNPSEPSTSESNQSDLNASPPVQLNYASVVNMVQKSVQDVNYRLRNVIVTGLVERDGGNDVDIFTNLCINELGVKPLVYSTKRLGKVNGAGHRKLLVRLTSESAAMDLIYSSRNLRKSKDPYISSKVFINKDLTKEQAKLAYERRQSRRQAAATSSDPLSGGLVSSQVSSVGGGARTSSLTFVNSARKGTTVPSNASSGLGVNSLTTVTSNVTASDHVVDISSLHTNGVPMSSLVTTTATRSGEQLNPSADEFSPNVPVRNSQPTVDQAVANAEQLAHA